MQCWVKYMDICLQSFTVPSFSFQCYNVTIIAQSVVFSPIFKQPPYSCLEPVLPFSAKKVQTGHKLDTILQSGIGQQIMRTFVFQEFTLLCLMYQCLLTLVPYFLSLQPCKNQNKHVTNKIEMANLN